MLGEGKDKQGSGLHSWEGKFKKDATIYFKKLCYYTHGSFVYFYFFCPCLKACGILVP